jgi:hypothetical protein
VNLWKSLLGWWRKYVWWKLTGYRANKQIEPGGKKRDEAEEQLARVLYETGIRPDAIAATTMRGGPAFIVSHDGEKTVTIDHTYKAAADEAIAWLKEMQGEIVPKKLPDAPVMSRAQRRGFAKRVQSDKRRGTPAHFKNPPRKKKDPRKRRGKR